MEHTKTIRDYIVENFLFGDGETLQEDTSFLENGIVDSTGIMELLEFVEDEWGISVEDSELTPENFDSVSKVAAFVASKRN